MSKSALPPRSVSHPGWLAVGVAFLFYAAVMLRTVAAPAARPRLPLYLALESLYLISFAIMLWRPVRQPMWRHAYLLWQACVVFALQALSFSFDFIIVLYVLLCYQSALLLQSPGRWIWVGVFLLLSCGPLMIALGTLPGLAMALMSMTMCLIFPAYVTVTQDIEAGLQRSRTLLEELQAANRQLTTLASQVEELAAIQERNRLARELHDSVSQTIFGISLHTRAAQILLARDPERLRPQLEHLQTLTQSALGEMRGLIAHLRPQPR